VKEGSFSQNGFALPTSGERDDEINLSGLENYTIGHSSDVEQIQYLKKHYVNYQQ